MRDSVHELGLLNGSVYKDGGLKKLNIYIDNGIISKLTDQVYDCEKVVDCAGKMLLPGFIDPHVHLNLNLGEFTSSDDFSNGTKAAAYGGFTTIIDFLNPVNRAEEFERALEEKMAEGRGSNIDYSFHTTIGNYKEHPEPLAEKSLYAGIPSIKLFTTYSESDRKCNDGIIVELVRLSKEKNLLVMCHTENDGVILNHFKDGDRADGIENYEESRPEIAEICEMAKLAEIAELEGGRLYFVHVTCGSSVKLLKDKYSSSLNKHIFIESCPQYFYLTKDKYMEKEGALYLLAPPLRSNYENGLLKEHIDTINVIGTDHCPFMRNEKLKYDDSSTIPKGLGGLEYSFSLMYTLYGNCIIDKFTENPAKIHGLFPKKGVLSEGSDGDVVIFDPYKSFIVDSGHSKCDYSPYDGIKLTGQVISTILRGKFIIEDGKFIGGQGEFQRRV